MIREKSTIYLDRWIWINSHDNFFWIFVIEPNGVIIIIQKVGWSDTEDIWSTFFNAIHVWVRAIYLWEGGQAETKLCNERCTTSSPFVAHSLERALQRTINIKNRRWLRLWIILYSLRETDLWWAGCDKLGLQRQENILDIRKVGDFPVIDSSSDSPRKHWHLRQ